MGFQPNSLLVIGLCLGEISQMSVDDGQTDASLEEIGIQLQRPVEIFQGLSVLLPGGVDHPKIPPALGQIRPFLHCLPVVGLSFAQPSLIAKDIALCIGRSGPLLGLASFPAEPPVASQHQIAEAIPG